MAVKNVVGGGVPDAPEKKRAQEKETVGLMIELYCRGHHGTRKGQLCPDCAAKTHCYKPEMRARIRDVMRWSGPRMLFHHPVMAVRHLVETRKQKKAQ